jgi:hypothetical protein
MLLSFLLALLFGVHASLVEAGPSSPTETELSAAYCLGYMRETRQRIAQMGIPEEAMQKPDRIIARLREYLSIRGYPEIMVDDPIPLPS